MGSVSENCFLQSILMLENGFNMIIHVLLAICSCVVNAGLTKDAVYQPPACPQMKDNFPAGPLVPCSFLPEQFVTCNSPEQAPSTLNETESHSGYCSRFGGQRAEDVEWTNVTCWVIDCSIECRGERFFPREVPCIKYTGHYFLSTLLYSVLLGVVAVDRFCLGYSAIAVGKLMTLGGLGVWWIIDIFLLVTGNLTPADGSNWEPYY